MKKNHHGSQNESSTMKHTIKIKGALGTLCIICMAWAGQGLAAEKPASPPTAAERKSRRLGALDTRGSAQKRIR